MRKAGGALWAIAAGMALGVAVPTPGWCGQHSLTLYGGLFGNKEYVQGWEGVAASVGVAEPVSIIGRLTGVHYFEADRFRDGDAGIGEGGLAFHLAPNTTLSVLGGTYFGDIEDPLIDGSLTTAQMINGRWFQLSVSGLYGFDSERWQTSGYLATTIADLSDDLTLFGGVESVIYNEGRFLRDGDFFRNPDKGDVKVQAGPVIELYKRSWDAGLRLGVGGGDYGVYGTASIYKRFGFGS
jgi:hypothetical protein